MQKISIVIPVYNEAENIDSLVRSFYKILEKLPDSEMIIAEDGSTDGTKEKLTQLKNQILFTLISGEKRKGYNQAVKDALKTSKKDIILFSDSSGQHDPNDYFLLSKYINDYDMVVGYKSQRQDPLFRLILSKGYNLILRLLFGIKLHDINCGFRLIKRNVIEDILPQTNTFKKYNILSEFTVRANHKGYKIREVAIHHLPRTKGEKKSFFISNVGKVIYIMFRDILALKKELKNNEAIKNN